ncbi:Signal transduction histidine kinase [Streptomyces sp. 3213]|uniref:sensor histidine kinase n=1 Tax=Streptomyces sp. 3213.3 TaxID=1855348 RepID=UPI00089B8CF5|nr:histidine kinase [Streptomyces sp. 3213.3]SEE35178.1 Signal transduction histidine kinase [Streptomyces sp. 3213] [Streptomyces sp. 3213.3]
MRDAKDTDDHARNSALPHRTALTALGVVMALLWVVDVAAVASDAGLEGGSAWWRPVPGLVAAVALLLPGRRLAPAWGAGAAVLLSWTVTLALFTSVQPWLIADWGLLETLCLLLLLVRTMRDTPQPWLTATLGTALASAVIAAPMRMHDSGNVYFSFLLIFFTGGAVGIGSYLRGLDDRRSRAVADTRHHERLELARELHDFVAHHVTGIVVQAQAAQAIREIAPEQVDPLLRGIEQAGGETLQSMRKLVRVLRDDTARAVRPGELYAELGELVATFSERDAPATLQVAAEARQARPAPEVETSVRNVVREALTNVRRHAPGSPSVSVRVALSDDDGGESDSVAVRRLRVEVHNAPPPRNAAPNAEPLGGRGGLGLIGLTERAEAVGGTLRASRAEDGGWRLTAEFPVRGAVAGSPA